MWGKTKEVLKKRNNHVNNQNKDKLQQSERYLRKLNCIKCGNIKVLCVETDYYLQVCAKSNEMSAKKIGKIENQPGITTFVWTTTEKAKKTKLEETVEKKKRRVHIRHHLSRARREEQRKVWKQSQPRQQGQRSVQNQRTIVLMRSVNNQAKRRQIPCLTQTKTKTTRKSMELC